MKSFNKITGKKTRKQKSVPIETDIKSVLRKDSGKLEWDRIVHDGGRIPHEQKCDWYANRRKAKKTKRVIA